MFATLKKTFGPIYKRAISRLTKAEKLLQKTEDKAFKSSKNLEQAYTAYHAGNCSLKKLRRIEKESHKQEKAHADAVGTYHRALETERKTRYQSLSKTKK